MWKLAERLRALARGGESESSDDWKRTMHTLRPQFDEAKHGYYVDLLVQQITSDDPPRNVAVAGSYGSGKSSVLAGLRGKIGRKFQPVEISLATLNQSKQALLDVSGETTLTAALQKEVVKRLLYSAKPSDLPRSRFDRISGVRWGSALGIAVVLATGVLGLVFMLKMPTPFDEWSGSWHRWQPTGRLLDWLSLVILVLGAQAAFSSSRLREIGIGTAKLSLDAKGGDYFDKYLDEIVYFFQKSKTRVVVFEDLDRFDDPGIFQALRELNNLLNNSDQIKRNVTFVHAIRDSLFERNLAPAANPSEGDGDAAAPRAYATDVSARIGTDSAASDRAKFFDLVVPLVPFISHEVSADLIVAAFVGVPEDQQPSRKLMALAGRHITDMRVIHSVRNEYVVFTAELLDKTTVEGLKDDRDQLFAMVLYKHHYLHDFERIRTGGSKLDELVSTVSDMTRARLASLEIEIASLENDIEATAAVDRRAEAAGQRLLDEVQFLIRVLRANATVQNVLLQGDGSFAPDDVRSRAFWEALDASQATQLTVSAPGQQIAVLRADFPRLFGQDFPPAAWLRTAVEDDQSRLAQLEELRERLLHASLRQRVTDTAFVGEGQGANVESGIIDIPACSIDLMEEGLALDLIRGGYIDQNFGKLRQGPSAVGDLAAAVGMEQSAVSPPTPAPAQSRTRRQRAPRPRHFLHLV